MVTRVWEGYVQRAATVPLALPFLILVRLVHSLLLMVRTIIVFFLVKSFVTISEQLIDLNALRKVIDMSYYFGINIFFRGGGWGGGKKIIFIHVKKILFVLVFFSWKYHSYVVNKNSISNLTDSLKYTADIKLLIKHFLPSWNFITLWLSSSDGHSMMKLQETCYRNPQSISCCLDILFFSLTVVKVGE